MPNAKTKATSPKLQLLNKVIRTTLYTCGRFPAHLKHGDFIESLVIEGVSIGLPLLRRSNADLIAGAKSIARRLIRTTEIERSWWERDETTGKMVYRSKAAR
jgi:hypothetical protein